jgi:citrate lyase subunit beta / citryl-CoA lyase
MTSAPPTRSWLFAPGSNERLVGKALAGNADAVVLDLEDAVPLDAKEQARSQVAVAVASADRPVFVRINALTTPFAFDDVAAVVRAGAAGIVLPMTSSATDVSVLHWLVEQHERRAPQRSAGTEIMPLLETGAGIAEAPAISRASPRVRRLALGAADLTVDMGMEWTRDEDELLPYRSRLVLASRTAGLEPPIDSAWVDLDDAEGMSASARRARRDGFQGKLCIHPTQVAAVARAYTPSADAVAHAERVLAAFAEAESQGVAALRVDGRLVDYPVVEAARRTVAEAARARQSDPAPEPNRRERS